MSKKKKIGIILILMIIVGYFAYGTLTTAEQEKEKKFISEPLTEDKFELVKFSTVDYPTLKATLYLATSDTNSGVVRLITTNNSNLTNTNIELKQDVNNETGTEIVNGESGFKKISKSNDDVTIYAKDMDKEYSVTKGSSNYEYYKIVMEWTSDDSTNAEFKVEFKVISGGSTKATSTIANYTFKDIKAEFVNPSRVAGGNPQLIRENNQITLKGKAYAKLKRGVYTLDTGDITNNTTIDGTIAKFTEATAVETDNKPITSGKFDITSSNFTGIIGTVGVKETIEGKDWYPVTLEMSASAPNTTVKDVYASLLSNPTGHSMKFTAYSDIGSDYDELWNVGLVEKDPPIITNITMTNNTLKTFMTELFPSSNISSYVAKSVSNSTGLTNSDLTNNLLNVKDADNVNIKFTVDDENITSAKGTLNVTYNGIMYSYVNGTPGSNPITPVSNSGTKTVWEITVPNYIEDSNIVSFDITDASLSPNTVDSANSRLTLFTKPPELENTKFNPNTNIAGTTVYSNYYKGDLTVDTSGTNDAIAYIVTYDLDKSKSDTPVTEIVLDYKGILKSSPTVSFDIDGYYTYASVYTINKAGAIKTITSSTINTLDSIKTEINKVSKDLKFYKDTVAPRVTNYNFNKNLDYNFKDSSYKDNVLVKTLLTGNKPYKTGDYVEVQGIVKEYSMAETVEPLGIVNWNVIPTSGTYDVSTGASYEKKGTAVDLTTTTGKVTNKMISNFYDKAGNVTIPNSVVITFDDIKPSSLVTKALINGGGYKYTNDTSLPLEIVTGVPLSVAFVNTAYIGDVSNAATTNVNLTSFTGFEAEENLINNLVIQTYSYSGEKGTATPDSIILDTQVNGGASFVNENYTTSGSYNVFNLNSLLDNVTELVGLKSFTVTKSGVGSNAKISDNGTEKSLGTEIYLADYSAYKEILTPTIYSALSTPRNYKLLIPKGISGKMTYNIMLKDRLNNYKNLNYTVIITGKTNIIGTSKNSNMKITTTISNGSEMKIQARTE